MHSLHCIQFLYIFFLPGITLAVACFGLFDKRWGIGGREWNVIFSVGQAYAPNGLRLQMTVYSSRRKNVSWLIGIPCMLFKWVRATARILSLFSRPACLADPTEVPVIRLTFLPRPLNFWRHRGSICWRGQLASRRVRGPWRQDLASLPTVCFLLPDKRQTWLLGWVRLGKVSFLTSRIDICVCVCVHPRDLMFSTSLL